MPRIRYDKKKPATPAKRAPIPPPPTKKAAKKVAKVAKKTPARRNPFLRHQDQIVLDPIIPTSNEASQIVFDLIIPISNGGFGDFKHRAANLELILAELPPQVHAILVEQTVSAENPNYRDRVKVASSCNHTWISVSAPIFNKPWLYNIGARNAKSHRLLFSEADVGLENHYFAKLLTWLNEHKYQWCIAWSRIIYWQQDMMHQKARHKPSRGGFEGGVVYMSKPFFWKIGGYNEWMQQLGGMDNEIIRRAEAVSRSKYFPWTIDHLWHPVSKYKTSSFRDLNKRIYKSVKNNPSRMSRILKRYASQAGGKAPLCKSRKPEWLQ